MPKKKDKETNPILSKGLDNIEKAINEDNLGIAVTLAEELLKEVKKMPNKKEVIMPTGNGPDCYNGINKEEDAAVKLAKIVDDWWEELTADEKFKIYFNDKGIDY